MTAYPASDYRSNYQKEYRQSDRYREYNREYQRRYRWGKAKKAAHHAAERAARYGDSGVVDFTVFARLHQLPCVYCGEEPAGTADHVIPLSAGGPNSIENLAPACLSCNVRKSWKAVS